MKKLFNRLYLHNKLPEPLLKVTISQTALINNYRCFEKISGVKIAPVLKSNAYGHGLIEVATVLKDLNSPFVVVDSFYEAKMLRRAAIDSSILVIGYSTLDQIKIKLHEVSYVVTSLGHLSEISENLQAERKFHIKIDTGMRRQGISPSEVDQAIKLVKKNRNIIIDGVCSHFADADNEDNKFTNQQIETWNNSVAQIKEKITGIRYFHIAATAGTFYSEKICANVARLGIGLYGINPVPEARLDLQPALEMRAIIAGVKTLLPGEGIGYNLTHIAEKDSRIAIIPAGYYEGVDRRLSNKGSFLIGGRQCPMVGRVCMNISMADVSAVSEKELTYATIISADPKEVNCVENLAKICQTNPHELLVHIPAHLRREVI